MAIDPYALCPCGSGKKLKFCCSDLGSEIEKVHEWAAETMPSRSAGYFIGASVPHYIDDLLSDMGIPLQRRPDFIRENFFPLFPSRYASLGDERRMIRDLHVVGRLLVLSN